MIDRVLLNAGFAGSTWGNLGLWTDEALDYPAACEALAVRLAQAASLQPGCSVLDVGFGYGDQLLVWKKRFGVGAITGLEIDPIGIAEAHRKTAAYGDIQLRLVEGPLPRLNHCDRVLALDCAYHFTPRASFFAHAMASLRPGGVLALTDLVLGDGRDHTRLAKACGIPPENLLSQQAYAQALADLGFVHITFESLDDQVLSGFARFGARLLRRRGLEMLRGGGPKVLATAALAAWMRRGQRMRYMLVRAERPA